MSSDIPRFQEPGSGDDDARWEAYQALLRRTAPPPPELEAEANAEETPPIEPASFAPREEPAEAYAGPEPDEPVEPLPNPYVHSDPPEATPAASAPARTRRPAVRRRMGLRLVGGATALTAGIIFAAALVPRQPAETRPARPLPAAPVHAAGSAGPVPAHTAPVTAPPTPRPAAAVTVAPLSPAAAHAPALQKPVEMAAARPSKPMAAVDTPVPDANADARPARLRHDRAKAASAHRTSSSRYGALSCWLALMNNGPGAGSRDAGLSICQGEMATARLNRSEQNPQAGAGLAGQLARDNP